MKSTKLFSMGILLVLSVLVPLSSVIAAAPLHGSVLVGHVFHTEGDLLYFVPESKDWVAAVSDAPFGIDDAYYSGEDGRAEFLLPNRTSLRIGPTTQVQLITLNENLTQVDVAAGISRFFNDSETGIIKATTPFGYVVAEYGSVFDVYVGDHSVEVIPIEGAVDFVSERGRRYPIDPGSSIIADAVMTTAGDGTLDSEWQYWNDQRDEFRARRLEVKGQSVKYLPEGLYDQSAALEEHGRWESVHYEGQQRD
ncbi:MAG: hypothetical protein AAGU11_23540, partial [Syntrophobacteraceae bacterium]